jgi:hypothetical protein
LGDGWLTSPHDRSDIKTDADGSLALTQIEFDPWEFCKAKSRLNVPAKKVFSILCRRAGKCLKVWISGGVSRTGIVPDDSHRPARDWHRSHERLMSTDDRSTTSVKSNISDRSM